MRNTKIPTVLHFLGTLLVMVSIFSFHQAKVRADAPVITINEIMYHPVSGNEDDEFVEIHNTTGTTVDLENWCFTDGVVLCFGPGATIAAGAYAVVSPNATQTLATYSVTTIGTYTGRLANSGEMLVLRDNSSTIINSITYDDSPPWPTTPDGTGPSLALKDPAMDNSLSSSWAACPCGSSPGLVNEVFTAGLPDIVNLSTPQNVLSSATPTITVNATDATTVTLTYKVMFGAEQSTSMYDDGNHGDGSSGDGVYGAVIPAQAAGKLVRFKVSATNANGTQTKPGASDTINYQGYVVQDPVVTSQLPVIQWFMEDSERDAMIADHSFDDQDFPTVVAYGNNVYDNTKVHIKGGVKRVFPKKSFAFELPQGYKLQISPDMTRSVDEFHLDSDYVDPSGTSLTAAWQIAKESGLDIPQIFKVRLQNNSDFYGLYTFLEEDDKTWREVFGYENMSYHGTDKVKTNIVADPVSEIQQWKAALMVPKSITRRDYAVDNSDIPNMINYMAFMAIIHNCEWHNGKNMIKAHDVLDTNRWKMLAHDIDCTMTSAGNIDRQISPFDAPFGGYFSEGRFQFAALYEELDFREGFYRRLRTLADEYYGTDKYLDMIQDLYTRVEADAVLDSQKWQRYGSPQQALEKINEQYYKTKKDLLVRYRYHNVIPPAQTSNPVINIESLNVNINNHQEDYIKLQNNTAESIDISGWKIEELNYTIPSGSVIVPGQAAYLPRHDVTFKLVSPGSYVLGQLKQDIGLLSQLTLRRVNNTVSDTESVAL